MTDDSTASGTSHHQSRLIPLWVAGVGVFVAVIALLVVLVIAKSVFSQSSTSAQKAEKEVVDQTGIATSTDNADHPPQRDIRIGTCESDGQAGVRAAGTITNWTDAPSDYRVVVSFRNDADGTEFAATSLTLDDVTAHRTSNWSTSVPSRPDVVFTCRIVSIDRWDAGTRPSN
jgi:Na+-transporting methylmalonyl-CoA/oxaloacetate decarboxylase gamma subunit